MGKGRWYKNETTRSSLHLMLISVFRHLRAPLNHHCRLPSCQCSSVCPLACRYFIVSLLLNYARQMQKYVRLASHVLREFFDGARDGWKQGSNFGFYFYRMPIVRDQYSSNSSAVAILVVALFAIVDGNSGLSTSLFVSLIGYSSTTTSSLHFRLHGSNVPPNPLCQICLHDL